MKKIRKFSRGKYGIAALIIFLLLLTGCNQPNEINLEEFTQNDGFIYRGIAWGSSPEETEKLLGYDIGEVQASNNMHVDKTVEHTRYFVEDTVAYNGHNGRVSLEFHNDGVTMIAIGFGNLTSEESEKLYQEITEKLLAIHGEPVTDMNESREETVYEEGAIVGEHDFGFLQWEKKDSDGRRTLLGVSRIDFKDNAQVSVSVNWDCYAEENSR